MAFTWGSWAFFGVGLAMDIGLSFKEKSDADTLEKGSHSDALWTGMYGIGHLAISIWGYKERGSEMTAKAFAAECIGSITEMSYLLLTIGSDSNPAMYKIVGGVEAISSVAVPACTAADISFN